MATQATPRADRSRVVAEVRAKDSLTYNEVYELIERLLMGSALTVA